MREFNALEGYPEPKEPRYVARGLRTIQNRIIASYRDREFYDGDRNNGYGGFRYDGRWKIVAKRMAEEYRLTEKSSILQVGCEKGFLLHDFQALLPGVTVKGIEVSDYAIEHSLDTVRDHIQKAALTRFPFQEETFDLVIGLGVVYALNLADAIQCLKEIQRVTMRHSFITLGSYDSEEEFRMFRYWTLLGCTILSSADWIEVLKHAQYGGDYKFVSARSLKLVERIRRSG